MWTFRSASRQNPRTGLFTRGARTAGQGSSRASGLQKLLYMSQAIKGNRAKLYVVTTQEKKGGRSEEDAHRARSDAELRRRALCEAPDHANEGLFRRRLDGLDRVRVVLAAVRAGARSPDHKSVAGPHLDRVARTEVDDAAPRLRAPSSVLSRRHEVTERLTEGKSRSPSSRRLPVSVA